MEGGAIHRISLEASGIMEALSYKRGYASHPLYFSSRSANMARVGVSALQVAEKVALEVELQVRWLARRRRNAVERRLEIERSRLLRQGVASLSGFPVTCADELGGGGSAGWMG